MGNSGAERIARWVVVALLAGVFPLVAWSGGCSSKTFAEPDASAGGSGGTSGAGGTTGVGGTTGAGGTAAVGGGGGTCSTGRGGFNGYNYVPPPCGGSGGSGGAAGAAGQSGGGAGGQGGSGNTDAGSQCCSSDAGSPRCSDDGRQVRECRYTTGSTCGPSIGTYAYVLLVTDCPNGCVADAGVGFGYCRP